MKIGGFQKFSLIDFPGEVCAVVFTQGCNFRCPYCHNPELVLPEQFGKTLSPALVLDFLKTRKGRLSSVTITGGEPALQPALLDFLQAIKSIPLKIKLDTNGAFPETLEQAFSQNLLDFVAMDIKAPLEAYDRICGCPVEIEAIEKSIALILASGVRYQFRTTLVPKLHSSEMKAEIERWMTELGATHIFQEFVPAKVLDASLRV
ncbi:anaerobic ribonucleoside-triphosphate reductase activating protein [Chloroherpeton thalassium ATCC 35110]|uniref:Anaerobic ribonucleoside-triphosphate reductase activating protein n=1 Tax=Chloroherpeton thalassium (strain ATCC 35110 / GB-78) TaxID=517418 RepID=B3QVU8_CHLT3|nr:anaerobic ribonucleoside-triphosphate reductase activating protein [Chloroherpeton thalassium]ACF13155.1 anaerobic ribonucleoside-triphosphate reductase activating protein [Chloroherpeton thalassium ATCC 35110]